VGVIGPTRSHDWIVKPLGNTSDPASSRGAGLSLTDPFP